MAASSERDSPLVGFLIPAAAPRSLSLHGLVTGTWSVEPLLSIRGVFAAKRLTRDNAFHNLWCPVADL